MSFHHGNKKLDRFVKCAFNFHKTNKMKVLRQIEKILKRMSE